MPHSNPSDVFSRASKDANDFAAFLNEVGYSLEHFFSNDDDEEEQKFRESERELLVSDFVSNVTNQRVSGVFPTAFPFPGYASWLFRLGELDGAQVFTIALDPKQISDWAAASRIRPSTLRIRSMLHELGHYHFSDGVRPMNGGPFFSAASPEEEMSAWIYSISFFGVLVGLYSVLARKNSSTDDAPRLNI